MIYIMWNNFDNESIKKAEQKKKECENLGYTLINSSSNCLTYKK